MQTEAEKIICGRSSDTPRDGYYEFHWSRSRPLPLTNENGISGWGRIVRTTNAVYPYRHPPAQYRIHLCSFQPCRAKYPHSRYGEFGPPLHLFEVPQEHDLSTRAESSLETALLAAGSGPVEPNAVVEPIPVEELATALEQGEAPEPVVETVTAEVPHCPTLTPLVMMTPPAPLSPMPGMEGSHSVANVTAVAATLSASPAVAA